MEIFLEGESPALTFSVIENILGENKHFDNNFVFENLLKNGAVSKILVSSNCVFNCSNSAFTRFPRFP